MSLFASKSSWTEKKPSAWRLFSATRPSGDARTRLQTSQTGQMGHYRTHSSLASESETCGSSLPQSSGNGSGAQIFRRQSQAQQDSLRAMPSGPLTPPLTATTAAAKPTADLPMMEECDRRVLRPPRPARLKTLHKSTSLSSLSHPARPPLVNIPPVPSFGDSYRIPTTKAGLESPISLRPSSEPFAAVLVDIQRRPAPTATNQVLVSIRFGFSLAGNPDTSAVTLPLDMLLTAGGYLATFVNSQLQRSSPEVRVHSAASGGSKPSMTEDESGTESDVESEGYVAGTVLQDEYLKSLWLDSPATPAFDQLQLANATPSVRSTMYFTPPKNRARVRNQYIQQDPLPSPSSPFTADQAPLSARRQATHLVLSQPERKGTITEVTVLLMRNAASWHRIVSRLALGIWSGMDEGEMAELYQELHWAGMLGLALKKCNRCFRVCMTAGG